MDGTVTVVRLDMPERVIYLKGAEVSFESNGENLVIRDNDANTVATYLTNNIFGYYVFQTSEADYRRLHKATTFLRHS